MIAHCAAASVAAIVYFAVDSIKSNIMVSCEHSTVHDTNGEWEI